MGTTKNTVKYRRNKTQTQMNTIASTCRQGFRAQAGSKRTRGRKGRQGDARGRNRRTPLMVSHLYEPLKIPLLEPSSENAIRK